MGLDLNGLRGVLLIRVSTDRQDESIEVQEAQGRQWIEAPGATYVRSYTDRAVRGSEFLKRAGLTKLMADAAEPDRDFDFVVMRDGWRAGRDVDRTMIVLRNLRDLGLRVFYYLTNEEVKLDSALDRMMKRLEQFAGEIQREKHMELGYEATVTRFLGNPKPELWMALLTQVTR